MNNLLVQIKSQLMSMLDFTIDKEASEYLIDLIDWAITDRITVNLEYLNELAEEIAITSEFQHNEELLDVVLFLYEGIKENYGKIQLQYE